MRWTCFAFVLLCITCPLAAEPTVTTVAEGLTNPCGVAIQPETGVVFVADSGKGRIVRIVHGQLQDVIVNSKIDVYGKGPKYDIGPLGIAFINKNTLVVADGGHVDGEEYLRVYEIPEPFTKPLDYENDAVQKSGPLAGKDDQKPEGNLYAIAVTKGAVFVTCNGDDTKGWIAKATLDGTKLGPLERFIPSKEAVNVDAPVGAAISPRGELVIGQMGEINKPKDSLLTFYNVATGKMLKNDETGLFDITALAYSPKTGLLYATDFAWMEASAGGLYRIDKATEGSGVKVKKITALEKPTAMAFAADGSVYVTVIGTPPEGEQAAATGKLLKIDDGL